MSYGKVKDTFWTDEAGVKYALPAIGKRLRPHIINAHSALRAFVFKRDKFTCQKCGYRPAEIPENYDGRSSLFSFSMERRDLQVDHKIPRSKGGSNHPTNLQTLCMRCNCSKCDRSAS